MTPKLISIPPPNDMNLINPTGESNFWHPYTCQQQHSLGMDYKLKQLGNNGILDYTNDHNFAVININKQLITKQNPTKQLKNQRFYGYK